MAFLNIDAPGNVAHRRGVKLIQRTSGSELRKTAAQERRDRRAAKRAGPTAIVFFPWPIGDIHSETPDGAYAQGPNGEGRYQVVVVGPPKGEPDLYAAAVSKWVGLRLKVEKAEPLAPPDEMPNLVAERGFLSICLAPAE